MISPRGIAFILLGLVGLQRLIELPYAQHNTKTLLARGGREYGARHYPLFILLHAGWLVSMAAFLPAGLHFRTGWLVLYAVLQLLRLWVLLSLGEYWTTRIITVPGEPLVRRGPYRVMRHPNYLLVIGEIAALPLAFGEVLVAFVFSILNLALLAWRIRIEDQALLPRRTGAA